MSDPAGTRRIASKNNHGIAMAIAVAPRDSESIWLSVECRGTKDVTKIETVLDVWQVKELIKVLIDLEPLAA